MSEVAAAARALKAGRLVILPTETVYGLAADAANPAAVAALYEAKGRPRFNPLIAHVAGPGGGGPCRRIRRAGRNPGPSLLARPAHASSPQPGTAAAVCDLARAGLDTVAVRVPAHPLARAVLEAVRRPDCRAIGQSLRPAEPDHLRRRRERDRRNGAAVALDGGPCGIGLESTVVALLDGPPRLLRPGAVTRAEIEALIGPLAEAEADARRSPGRLTRHYAPAAPLRLDAAGARPGEAFIGVWPTDGAEALNLSPVGDLAEAAARLFACLRAADALCPTAIAVAPIPEAGLGEAINDRLRRAAGLVG